MTIEELRSMLHSLESNLAEVGGERHNKSASARARLILGKIKNATPQLRKELIELDKGQLLCLKSYFQKLILFISCII
jgi:hypothetical protein